MATRIEDLIFDNIIATLTRYKIVVTPEIEKEALFFIDSLKGHDGARGIERVVTGDELREHHA